MAVLIQGDAVDTLRLMRSESVDSCICSRPYFRQRDYGVIGQIGQERSIQEYLERLWAVFDEVMRVLTPDGTCWVNLGDKYVDRSLQLVPEQFALGMKKRGWIVRNALTWHKTNPKPESVKSRFGNDSEPIYMFAKTRKHYFALQYEPYSPRTLKRFAQVIRNGEEFDPRRHKYGDSLSQSPMAVLVRTAKNLHAPRQSPHGMHLAQANGLGRDMFDSQGRTMRSVWALPVARCKAEHFAVWPPELVRRMICAGCPPGGILLDPFVGVGTSLIVAESLGCVGIGIDINPNFLEIARQEILTARAKRARAQAHTPKRARRRGRITKDNCGGRGNSMARICATKQEEDDGVWSTPGWLFGLLHSEYHFTLDAAALRENAKCPTFFTATDNGLVQSWHGHTVWCNPPWDKKNLEQWLEKAYQESQAGVTVVMLLPYWKGYDWFDQYCIARGQIRHIKGKVQFKGTNKATALDCVVVVFGADVPGYSNGPTIRKPGKRNGTGPVSLNQTVQGV